MEVGLLVATMIGGILVVFGLIILLGYIIFN
jgi:hypothetical protein